MKSRIEKMAYRDECLVNGGGVTAVVSSYPLSELTNLHCFSFTCVCPKRLRESLHRASSLLTMLMTWVSLTLTNSVKMKPKF